MRQIDYQLNSSKYILKEENKINPYTNRLRMDSYKGMTPKEIQDILDYQERQRQENHVNINMSIYFISFFFIFYLKLFIIYIYIFIYYN